MAAPPQVNPPQRPKLTKLRRLPSRGAHDRATIDAILDEALVCHMGYVVDGQPFVIPTLCARIDDSLYVHGSAASRTLRSLAGGLPVCVTATLIDGLVLARSAFEHSVNYRSVVVFGTADAVVDLAEKEAVLRRFVDRLVPGRSDDIRGPTAKELKATSLLRVGLDVASAKVRTGPPHDEGEDLESDAWAGVIPLELRALAPIADPELRPGIPLPGYAKRYSRPA